MNYVEFVKKGKKSEKRFYIIAEDNNFPKELKEVLKDKENKIVEVSIDTFIIEDYKWILKYDNDDWIDEYCKRLYNRDGIRI